MGNSLNWLNDAYNNNEDIYISSFVRVLSVLEQEINLEKYKLISLFDEKVLEIASLMSRLSDEDETYISTFVQDDKNIFIELLGDWASMAYRNKLDDVEKVIMNRVSDLISEEKEDV